MSGSSNASASSTPAGSTSATTRRSMRRATSSGARSPAARWSSCAARTASVRALINSCTHRGARVCRQDRGNAKSFQCFYHAWTFNTEGALVGIPDKEGYAPGRRPGQLGLRHVAAPGLLPRLLVRLLRPRRRAAERLPRGRQGVHRPRRRPGPRGHARARGQPPVRVQRQLEADDREQHRRLPRRAAAPHLLRLPRQPGRRRGRQAAQDGRGARATTSATATRSSTTRRRSRA